ncbi:phosphotransferase [Fictibacillus iocasae]|uniref:Phosphotransferase n=1 Tax=Fictibacillus iocasae TaxID=2715437 RepID=A0ABW2NL27_9BACL
MKFDRGRLIGSGNTAKVYMYGNKAVKVFHERIHPSYIKKEFNTSQVVSNSGLCVPAVYELCDIEGRMAIVLERIEGISLNYLFIKKPINMLSIMKLMAKLHREMHDVSNLPLPSQKNHLEQLIHNAGVLTHVEKERILLYLEQLPESCQLCHGDFHPDNILISEDRPTIIDWMDATCGHPAADAARTYILLKYGGLSEQSGIIQRLIRRFISTIYLHDYCSKSLISKEMIKKWILPVAAARLCEDLEGFEKRQLHKLVQKLMTKIEEL